MEFILFPVAEASVASVVNSINKVLINPLIIFLFALATVYFLYGLAEYFLKPDNKDVKETTSKKIINGLIGMFIMMAVYGIMNLYLNTIGENRIKVDRDGSGYKVENIVD
jgi:hypothetical protein